MRLCSFEDRKVVNLEPLSLTRPAFDLLCGQTSLVNKHCRYFGASDPGAWVRPSLADCLCLQQPAWAVNNLSWLRTSPTVLVNGRWLPPPGPAPRWDAPCVALVGDEVAYAVLAPEQLSSCSPGTLDYCLETWKSTLPQQLAGGRLIYYLWQLVEHNAEQLLLDFEASPVPPHPASPAVIGPPAPLRIDARATP